MKYIKNKTLIKNDLIFLKLFIANEKQFLQPILTLRKELGLSKFRPVQWTKALKEEIDPDIAWKKITQWLLDSREKSDVFFNSLDVEKRNRLVSLINQIINSNSLGKEWFIRLQDFIITGFFIPPVQNFSIQEDKSGRKVSIELNPDTTIEDLKENWNNIKNSQERVFGKIKKSYLTEKSADNLILYAKSKEKKKHKLINIVTGEKYKPTDLDVVGQIFSDKEGLSSVDQDKKRVQRIRKVRSRLKS